MTDTTRPLRLGFPVKVMGKPGLKTQDTRRWQKNPHLKCSLELLDPVLDYLKAEKLDMYRLSSDIAPSCAPSGSRRALTISACRSTPPNMCCSTPPIPI
jgi:hypothetical protein